MASFELKKVIKSDSALDAQSIRQQIIDGLDKSTVIAIDGESSDRFAVHGRMKHSLFWTMAKFTANVAIQCEGTKAQVKVQGKTSPNWVFWLFLICGMPSGFILSAGALFIYFVLQKGKPNKLFEQVLEETAQELATQFSTGNAAPRPAQAFSARGETAEAQ